MNIICSCDLRKTTLTHVEIAYLLSYKMFCCCCCCWWSFESDFNLFDVIKERPALDQVCVLSCPGKSLQSIPNCCHACTWRSTTYGKHKHNLIEWYMSDLICIISSSRILFSCFFLFSLSPDDMSLPEALHMVWPGVSPPRPMVGRINKHTADANHYVRRQLAFQFIV